MKALKRVVCFCIKCENVTHCIWAINHFAVQHNHSQLQVPVDTTAISLITLCPGTTRNEATCGVDKLSDHFAELTANHEDHQIKYSLWECVEKKKEIPGKPPKLFTVTELVTKETSLKLLISLLKTSLVDFSGHLFRAK